MTNNIYIELRNKIDEAAWNIARTEFKQALELEKEHAIPMKKFWWDKTKKENVPSIRAEVDVGWSSIAHHHHNMSARASQVVVIGCFTGKPIYCATRQKGCEECHRAEALGQKNLTADQHRDGI